MSWLFVIPGLSGQPHHPQVGPAQLGQSLGGAGLLGLLPLDQVSRSDTQLTCAQVGLSEDGRCEDVPGTLLQLFLLFLLNLLE